MLSRYLVIKILKIYQKTLSFDYGIFKIFFPHGYCHFKPTCSNYAIIAIEKYGIIKGGRKALWRVLRCNPWNKGGWDPVDKL
ncbi:membrane protein insertion efficiency factor YidD [Patescibacteria group bacterium]|nr:membrane protein insertion efficiency factor YidD [Patescibacteria group bacterium]